MSLRLLFVQQSRNYSYKQSKGIKLLLKPISKKPNWQRQKRIEYKQYFQLTCFYPNEIPDDS